VAKDAKTYWLNMTTLSDPAKVGEALAALHAAQVPVAHIGVAGIAPALDSIGKSLIQGGRVRDEFVPLFADVEPVFSVPPDNRILATRNSFLASIKSGIAPPADAVEERRCWLDPSARNRLVAPLLQGSVLLVVNPSSHQQWMQGTRILLKHSQNSVLSHEIIR
jgi:hypothetical protein